MARFALTWTSGCGRGLIDNSGTIAGRSVGVFIGTDNGGGDGDGDELVLGESSNDVIDARA